jgi:xylulokinase
MTTMASADPAIAVTLDIGDGAASASAYDAALGVSLGSIAVAYPPPLAGADAGTFSPEDWWLAAVAALRGLRDYLNVPSGRYLGITVSAIRVPFVLVDGYGEVAAPCLLNRDRRAASQAADLAALSGVTELHRLTGHWPAAELGLAKLLWARASYPAAWRATTRVLQLHDWFIYKLCGAVVSEPSSAAMSQLLDVAAGTWASPLLAAIGVPASMLPELRRAGEPAGGLRPAVASQTGFAPGTPVHVGGGDAHLSAESAGASELAVPVVVAGATASVLIVMPAASGAAAVVGTYPLLVSEHVTRGRWAFEASAGLAGGVLEALGDFGEFTGPGLRAMLDERGIELRDGDDLMVLDGNPYFCPEGWACAPPPTVLGLRPEHTVADVRRASVLSICLALRSVLQALAKRFGVIAPFVVATGGMSRYAEWVQLLADVTGTQVRVRPLDQIAGRAGAALITGALGPRASAPGGSGRGSGPGATELVYAPRSAVAPAHNASFARYLNLYRSSRLWPDRPGTECSSAVYG